MTNKLPPEWAPQEAVLLAWPHEETDWNNNLTDAQRCYLIIIKNIVLFQKVILLCPDEQTKHKLTRYNFKNLEIVIANYNDTWCRDYGPITIETPNGLLSLDFNFNGWGNKHKFDRDNQINQTIQPHLPHPLKKIDFILEGGAIETDGNGVLLARTSCIINKNRHDFDLNYIENKLKNHFGFNHFLWLHSGQLPNDDTDGHIDTLARFINPNHICYSTGPGLETMECELNNFRDKNNQPYQLTPLPSPEPIYNNKNQLLPATYANFLIINQAVLLPIYNIPQDQLAIEILTSCFPDRRIIPINCRPLIEQYGSLHCISMQIAK